jgi:nicotinate phosphoribosyltransferase
VTAPPAATLGPMPGLTRGSTPGAAPGPTLGPTPVAPAVAAPAPVQTAGPDGGAGAVPAALVTDLYELTMAAAYQAGGIDHEATFELFVRSLPAQRRFLLAAGLDDALDGLESWRFDAGDVAYLDGLGTFPPGFVDRLADLRFTGEVWAVPEGEAVFAGEPLVRVTAPLVEAQVVETWLLNRIASQTMLASKAARVALACGDRSFVDFSARRDHGVDAAMAAARAAWMCGAVGTSLVAAGRRFGIPLSGTMAHSFVMSYDDERDAFRAYARSFPHAVVLLIDTYDTVDGARNAAHVAHELAGDGIAIAGVRLDSGDLGVLSGQVRSVLDDAGLADVDILASGDLDEHKIAALLTAGAPIDAFGVGTQLGTSADAPTLGAVYKLVEDADGPKMKLASGKVTLPGRKQVWRLGDRDVISLHDEDVPGGRPLLTRVMTGGRRTVAEPLARVRDRAIATIAALPAPLRSLETADDPVWPVEVSPGLDDLAARVHAGLDSERRT